MCLQGINEGGSNLHWAFAAHPGKKWILQVTIADSYNAKVLIDLSCDVIQSFVMSFLEWILYWSQWTSIVHTHSYRPLVRGTHFIMYKIFPKAATVCS